MSLKAAIKSGTKGNLKRSLRGRGAALAKSFQQISDQALLRYDYVDGPFVTSASLLDNKGTLGNSWDLDETQSSGTEITVFPGYVGLLRSAGNYGSHISTPDSPDNQVNGDLDLRIKYAESRDDSTLVSKGVQQVTTGFRFYITSSALNFEYSFNGTTSSAVSVAQSNFDNRTPRWVRVTRSVATGDVNFYRSSDTTDDSTQISAWTQIGTTQSTAAGALFQSTGPLILGSSVGSTGNYRPNAIIIRSFDFLDTIDGTQANQVFRGTDFKSPKQEKVLSSTGTAWTVSEDGAASGLFRFGVAFANTSNERVRLLSQGRAIRAFDSVNTIPSSGTTIALCVNAQRDPDATNTRTVFKLGSLELNVQPTGSYRISGVGGTAELTSYVAEPQVILIELEGTYVKIESSTGESTTVNGSYSVSDFNELFLYRSSFSQLGSQQFLGEFYETFVFDSIFTEEDKTTFINGLKEKYDLEPVPFKGTITEEQSAYIGTTGSIYNGLWLDSTGLYAFKNLLSSNLLQQTDLGTAFDVTTGGTNSGGPTPAAWEEPYYSLQLLDEGKYVFNIGTSTLDNINRLELNTPYNVGDGGTNTSVANGYTDGPGAFKLDPIGGQKYLVLSRGGIAGRSFGTNYELATPFDLSTRTAITPQSYDLSSLPSAPNSDWFDVSDDGVWVSVGYYSSAYLVNVYKLSTPWDANTAEFVYTADITSIAPSSTGDLTQIRMRPDAKEIYLSKKVASPTTGNTLTKYSYTG